MNITKKLLEADKNLHLIINELQKDLSDNKLSDSEIITLYDHLLSLSERISLLMDKLYLLKNES